VSFRILFEEDLNKDERLIARNHQDTCLYQHCCFVRYL